MRNTIDTHLALAAAYKRMMTEIENKTFVFYFEKQATKHNAIDILEIALEVILMLVFAIPLAFPGFTPGKKYIFKPSFKYLLGEHIRRQYQKLYSFYLMELVVQRKNCLKEELEDGQDTIAEGQRIHYSFVKPHKRLEGKPPCDLAGLRVPER